MLASLWPQLLTLRVIVVVGSSNADQPAVEGGYTGVDTGVIAATGTDAPGGHSCDHVTATDGTAAVTLKQSQVTGVKGMR